MNHTDITSNFTHTAWKWTPVSDFELYIEVTVLTVLAVAGTAGNIMTLITTIKNKTMRSSSHILFGLSMLVDLTVCIVIIPFNIYGLFAERWSLPEALCYFTGNLSVFTKRYTLTQQLLLALNRLFACFPSNTSCVYLNSVKAVIYIIIISILYVVITQGPLLLGCYDFIFMPVVGLCLPLLDDKFLPYYNASFLLNYGLMVCPIIVIYIMICVRLHWVRVDFQSVSHRRVYVKATKNMMLLTGYLLLCWLPPGLYSILTNMFQITTPTYVSRLCLLASYVFPSTNPVIYYWRMEGYRKGINKMFQRRPRRVAPIADPPKEMFLVMGLPSVVSLQPRRELPAPRLVKQATRQLNMLNIATVQPTNCATTKTTNQMCRDRPTISEQPISVYAKIETNDIIEDRVGD